MTENYGCTPKAYRIFQRARLTLYIILAILLIILAIHKIKDGSFGKDAVTRAAPFPRDGVAYFKMEVTAYCLDECCCEQFADGITASGEPAEGFFVAASPEIPFGTLMSVPAYAKGAYVPVLDRGGSIKGNKLDVFFPTHQEALKWGRRLLNVRIVK